MSESMHSPASPLNQGGSRTAPGTTSSHHGNSELEVNEFYTRMVALEKEMRIRDGQLERLTHEKKQIEKVSRSKESALLQLTTELMDAKKHVARMEDELRVKGQETRSLLEARKKEQDLKLENAGSIKNLEIETINDGSSVKLLPVDLYHHVMRLENDLHDRSRVVAELDNENRTLSKLLKQKEEDVIALTEDLKLARQRLIETQDPVNYENKIKEISSSVVEVQEENRMLLSIQKAKTQAIEELTKELNVRGATDQYVDQLKRELRVKDKEIADQQEDISKLSRVVEYKEAVINKFREEEVGIPFHLWQEERRLLLAEVHKQQEARASLEKVNRGQAERIAQLQATLDAVVKSADHGPSPAKALRASRRFKYSSSTPHISPTSPLAETPQNQNGVESAGLNDTSSSKLQDVLERNIQKMSISLSAKEGALAEKDDALEILQKKLEVMTKARATEAKKSKQLEVELREQIQDLNVKVQYMQAEFREEKDKLQIALSGARRRAIK